MKQTDRNPLTASNKTGGSSTFVLPPLPYATNALEPYISANTLSIHHGKHHQAYVDNLNKLVADTDLAGQSLESIISQTAGAQNKTIFNNAAQAWNHTFFWHSMTAVGGGQPTGKLLEMINASFGSVDSFKERFTAEALSVFGSGWVWLVLERNTLTIATTSNADTPMIHRQVAILACDVWEHTYYLDYQNRRKDFVQAFLDHLVDWEFASSQLN